MSSLLATYQHRSFSTIVKMSPELRSSSLAILTRIETHPRYMQQSSN